MLRAIVAALPGRAFPHQLDRCARHLGLGSAAVLGDLLDCVPVTVTRREVHLAVESAWVLTKNLFDGAQGLDKLAPVHSAQDTEAADAVAHRDLIGSLLLVLRLHQLLDGPPGFGKSLLNPGERQGQGGALPLQPARKFRNERAHHRRAPPRRRFSISARRSMMGSAHSSPMLRPVTVW